MLGIKMKLVEQIKKLMTWATVGSLLQLPYSISVMAQDRSETAEAAVQIANAAGGFMNHYMQQMRQLQIPNINTAQYQAQMIPQEEIAPAFRGCQVPQDKAPFPIGACEETVTQNDLVSIRMYMSLGGTNYDFYDTMVSETKSDTRGKYSMYGLQCMEGKKDFYNSQIQNYINSLNQLVDIQIRPLIKKMEREHEIQKKMMDETAGLLYGETRNDLNSKTKKLASYFSQDCQNLIGVKELAGFHSQGGLIGVMDQSFTPNMNDVAKYEANKINFQNDLNNQLDRMKNQISKYGIDGNWQNNIRIGNEKSFSKYQGIIKRKKDDLEIVRKRAKDYLGKHFPGFEIPDFSKEFSTDLEEFRSVAKDAFSNQSLARCLQTNLPAEDFLNGLRHGQRNKESSTLISYRQSLSQILNNPALSIAQKEAQIAALKSPGIVIRVKNSRGRDVRQTPIEYFREMKTYCKSEFEKYNTGVANQGEAFVNKKSYASRSERAEKYLNELQAAHDDFSDAISKDIMNEVLNCNGRAVDSGSCNFQSVSLQSESFQCFSHADTCANQIKTCHQNVKKLLDENKQKLKDQANHFISTVNSHSKILNQLMQRQMNQLASVTKMINTVTPKANFEAPTDLLLQEFVPKLGDQGVYSIQDQDLESLKNFPNKITTLIGSLEKQKSTMDSSMAEKISKHKKNMQVQAGNWKKLRDKCQGQLAQHRKNILDQHNASVQQYNKQFQQMSTTSKSFCQRFGELSASSYNVNPAAACGGPIEDIAEDFSKVVVGMEGGVTAEAYDYIKEYRGYCNDVQNNSSDSENEDGNPIYDLCEKKGSTGTKNYLAQTVANNTTDDKTLQKKIKDYINGDKSELPSKLQKIKEKQDNEEKLTSEEQDMYNQISAIEKLKESISKKVDSDDLSEELVSAVRDSLGINSITANNLQACLKKNSKICKPKEGASNTDKTSFAKKQKHFRNFLEDYLASNGLKMPDEDQFCEEIKLQYKIAAVSNYNECDKQNSQCLSDEYTKAYKKMNIDRHKKLSNSYEQIAENAGRSFGQRPPSDIQCEALANIPRQDEGMLGSFLNQSSDEFRNSPGRKISR